MQFEVWLIKQKYRNDPIGDLANDYLRDIQMCRQPYDGDYLNIDKQMKVWQACNAAINALREARMEHLYLFPDYIEEK